MAPGKFRFLDEIAPSDAAFEVAADDLNELFAAAAEALFSVIIDLDEISLKVSRQVTVVADTDVELLYDWLSQLVYLKDVYRELYARFDVSVVRTDQWRLTATIHGDSVDGLREKTRTDVKAVTYHKLEVVKTDKGYKATVVVDL